MIKLSTKFNILSIKYNIAIIDLLANYINISISKAVSLWRLLQLAYFAYPIKGKINPIDLVTIGNWLRILIGN